MRKKILVAMLAFFISLAFIATCCFAADNAGQDVVDGIRGAVNGAENAVEDAAKDISNASKEATGDMEKSANSVTNNVTNNNDANYSTSNNMNNNNTGDYMATRTSADGTATYMGMTATMWTWLIMAIAAIVIVALVWYYGSQRTRNTD